MNPEIAQLAQRLASALVNGLYQGVILALVLWVVLKLLRGSNAATRHAMAFVTLLLVAILPALHFVQTNAVTDLEDLPPDDFGQSSEPVTPGLDPAGRLFALEPDLPAGEPDRLPGFSMGGINRTPPPPGNVVPFPGHSTESFDFEEAGPVPELAAGLESWMASEAATEPAPVAPPPLRAAPVATVQAPVWRTAVPGWFSLVTVGLVMLIAAARSIRILRQLGSLRRLKRTGLPAPEPVRELFAHLIVETGLRRPTHLLVSERVQSPMALGFCRPVVMLPAGLLAVAHTDGFEGILRHELAHVQRRDDWSNLVQQVIGAICFFNPAVWWLSHRLTLDREIACDDHALARSRSRRDYALFLTEFAGRSRGQDWTAAPAAWSSRSQLKERIAMILDPDRNTSSRLARTSAGLVTLTTLAVTTIGLMAGPRILVAEAGSDAEFTAPREKPAVRITSAEAEPAVNGGTIATAGADARIVIDEPGSVISFQPASESSPAVAVVQAGRTIIPVEAAPPVDVRVKIAEARPIGPALVAQGAPPPLAPEFGGAPGGPRVKIMPGPAPRPAPVPQPAPGEGRWVPAPSGERQESLERRLERLERMLGRLVEERVELHGDVPHIDPFGEDMKPHDKDQPKDNPGNNANKNDSPDWGHFEFHLEEHPGWQFNEEHEQMVREARKRAEREVAQAVKEVERARQEAVRAQAEASGSARFGSAPETRIELERNLLDRQRRDVERQMNQLERQMQHLQEQLQKLDQREEQLHRETGNPGESEESEPDSDSLPREKPKATF